MSHVKVERTLIICKPDSVQRGIVGEILSRFERAGLKMVAMKMVTPDKDHYFHHYENIGKVITRRGQKVFDNVLIQMTSGPVLVGILEGIEAVSLVRKMCGATESKSALPGTIRGDYSHMSFDYCDDINISIPNVIHASGDLADAEQEIKHWFAETEIFDYQTTHEKYTQPKKK